MAVVRLYVVLLGLVTTAATVVTTTESEVYEPLHPAQSEACFPGALTQCQYRDPAAFHHPIAAIAADLRRLQS